MMHVSEVAFSPNNTQTIKSYKYTNHYVLCCLNFCYQVLRNIVFVSLMHSGHDFLSDVGQRKH